MGKRTFTDYCKRIRNLKDFKYLPEEEFLKKAKELYEKRYDKEVEAPDNSSEAVQTFENEVGVWYSQEEADEALRLYNGYQRGREFTQFSDKALLKELIYIEIEIKNIHKGINEKRLKSANENKIYIPTTAIRAISDLSKQSLSLKQALGLSEEQRKKDPLEELNKLRKRVEIWRRKNKHAFEARCPHCTKMVLWRWRVMDDKGNIFYNIVKHPFFKNTEPGDKIECNKHLWKMYKEGKITREDVAKVLETSVFYIEWLDKKVFKSSDKNPQ